MCIVPDVIVLRFFGQPLVCQDNCPIFCRERRFKSRLQLAIVASTHKRELSQRSKAMDGIKNSRFVGTVTGMLILAQVLMVLHGQAVSTVTLLVVALGVTIACRDNLPVAGGKPITDLDPNTGLVLVLANRQ
jgi:hypothetical protein